MESWLSLTDGRDIYLGGPSSQTFETPWGPNLSEVDQMVEVSLYATVTSGDDRRAARWLMETTGYPEVIKLRGLGCWLVMNMPEEGLIESITSLGEMMEYYSERPSIAQPKLTGHAVKGRATTPIMRPALTIPESE